MSSQTIHLEPAPIPPGSLSKFTDSNRTVAATFSPARTDLALWIAPRSQPPVRETNTDEDLGKNSGKVLLGGVKGFGRNVEEGKWKGVVNAKGEGVFDQDRTVWVGQVAGTDSGLNQVSLGVPGAKMQLSTRGPANRVEGEWCLRKYACVPWDNREKHRITRRGNVPSSVRLRNARRHRAMHVGRGGSVCARNLRDEDMNAVRRLSLFSSRPQDVISPQCQN